MFAAGFPGIPLRAAMVQGSIAQVAEGKSTRPLSDRQYAAVNGAQFFTNYEKYDDGDGSGIVPHATNYPGGAITPLQMRAVYGLASLTFSGGIVGNGAGQTIAIIDAYDNPNLFSSSTGASWLTSDLYLFDKYSGINAYSSATPPTFTKVNQTGGTSYPASGVANGWAGETILDVEWTHAMAPMANILLVEAADSSNNLYTAEGYARNQAAVSQISMSWGGSEFSGYTSYDATYFTSPSTAHPISFFASTGDSGANGRLHTSAGSYPSFSPNVVALGGTSLSQVNGTYISEGVYNGSGQGATGGGYSSFVPVQSYQSQINVGTQYTTGTTVAATFTNRTNPDLSLDGQPSTGVYVYDTSNGGWYGLIGGTSLSAPLMAGAMAVVNQGRAALGLSALRSDANAANTPNGTLSRLYKLPTSDFHDVTSGSNGYQSSTGYLAVSGYDLATGRGSPKGTSFVPDLVGGLTLSGTLFNDANGNGTFDGGETGLSGQTVYLDFYKGTTIVSENTTTTDVNGFYAFSDNAAGVSYKVHINAPSGNVPTTPATVTATGSMGATVTNNFGVFTGAFTGPAYTIQLDASGSNTLVYAAASATGTPVSLSRSSFQTLSFTGTSADDAFTIDMANGNPLAGMSLSFTGLGQSTGDVVNVVGTSGVENVTFGSSSLSIAGSPITLSGVERNTFAGAGGYDSVTTTSGATVTLTGGNVLASLNVANFSKVALATGGNVLTTQAVTVGVAGTLDLADGTMLLDYSGGSQLASITNLVLGGYNGGDWLGKQITSSAAAADLNGKTGVGIAEVSDILGLSAGDTGMFKGVAVDATTLVVKYTYRGDTNLDGVVDGSDIAEANVGLALGLTGWTHGDNNYDGTVDSGDYNTLLQVFRTQGAPIA